MKQFKVPACKSESNDEYEYSDTDDTKMINLINKTEGTRLVGARTATHSRETPFLVGYNINGGVRSQCTGTLISPIYFITASHCTDYIPKKGRLQKNEACVRETKAGNVYHIYKGRFQKNKITTLSRMLQLTLKLP